MVAAYTRRLVVHHRSEVRAHRRPRLPRGGGVPITVVQRTTREQLRRVAAETFGWSPLTAEQLAGMEHVMAGHDVLAVLPTGVGKSAT